MKAIYAGSTDTKGHRIFPGYMPGGELGPMGWAAYVSGTEPRKGSQFLYGGNFARDMVKEDAAYDPLVFNFDEDMPAAVAKLSRTIDATDPKLTGLRKHGGKLIQYHGWSDPGVSPLSSVNYYETVTQRLGNPSSFYRLFMVPGMQHCVGGPGPDHFDALAALERWVEQGQAPDTILASHMTDGKPDRTRPLCPYPQTAQWTGKGSTDGAANFRCETAKP